MIFLQAEKSFEASVKLEPDNAYNHSNLATAYFYQKKYRLAAKSNERAVVLNPDSYILQANLADAYRWSDQTEQAIKSYEMAINIINKHIENKPENKSLKIRKASYLAKAGAIELALDTLPDSLKESKAYMVVLAANVYELAGKRERVLELLIEAINLGYEFKNIKNEPEFDNFFASETGRQFFNRYSSSNNTLN